MAFYAVRGHPLEKLAGLTGTEKVFLGCARELYYKDRAEFAAAILNAAVGGKEA